MQTNDIDRFRGWALMALYASMAVLSLMLLLAAYRFWPSAEDGTAGVMFVGISGLATALLSARTSFQFFTILKSGERPRLAMLPFALMALTLFAASKLFTGVSP